MRATHLVWPHLVWTVALLGACGNPCMKLCDNLADYAEECGYSVPDAEVEACRAAQEAATPEDKEVCTDYGTPDAVRAQWTCDDMAIYWDGEGGGGTPGTTTGATEGDTASGR